MSPPMAKRVCSKSQSPIWKRKLRESCLRRVGEDRNRLLWKLRLSGSQSSEEKDIIVSAFQDIVSDELKKMEDPTAFHDDDLLWDYQGLQDAYQGDSEEILLEMQRMFYQDFSSDPPIVPDTWQDDEDHYLATLVSKHMLLNSQQELWCPICKQGELLQNHRHIFCNLCQMQLPITQEVNLNILQQRLEEVHTEHLERGCILKPKFSVQTHYNLKALYITCQACNTFEVVL